MQRTLDVISATPPHRLFLANFEARAHKKSISLSVLLRYPPPPPRASFRPIEYHILASSTLQCPVYLTPLCLL